MASYGYGGVQGGRAIIAPAYKKYVTPQAISVAINTPQTFLRVTGPQRILMTYTPLIGLARTWSFALTGGTNAVSPEGLPMFPRPPDALYNPTINYRINGADLPPFGCTILTLPVPPASAMTTRINIFQVTETVTGLGLSFIVACCPFADVDPTITYTGLPQTGSIELKVISYRASGDEHRAIGYPVSRGAPFYSVKNFPTTFVPVAGVNPLDAFNPLPFQRVDGQQTIIVSNTTTGFYFSFDVDYGIIGQGHGYLGYTFSPTANARLASTDIENAFLVSITSPSDPNAEMKIEQFVLAGFDGRAYRFTFDPSGYNEVPPTIQLLGPVLGGETLVVNVFVRYFQTL
jgi:hypothetical protein